MRRPFLVSACTVAFLSAGVGGAVAAVYESSVSYATVGGTTFEFKSRIDTSYRNTEGVTRSLSGNRYIGAEAQTFRDNGALCCVSGMRYDYAAR